MKKSFIIFITLFFYVEVFCQDHLNNTQLDSLKLQLDTIRMDDQKYRDQVKSVELKYGSESNELKDLWAKMHFQDSVNLGKIKKITGKYGWLSPDLIGNERSETIFLVIQHSNKTEMENYLPLLKEAFLKGTATADQYALLQDRVEMLNHRPQLYGTQIQYINGRYVLYNLLDKKNVNKRRKEIGLNCIEEYLKNWAIQSDSLSSHQTNP